eukprot:85937-Amphidinium_carterae.2
MAEAAALVEHQVCCTLEHVLIQVLHGKHLLCVHDTSQHKPHATTSPWDWKRTARALPPVLKRFNGIMRVGCLKRENELIKKLNQPPNTSIQSWEQGYGLRDL